MKMKKVLNKPDFPGYWISPEIKRMLDKSKDQVINQDWDRVFIIDGSEGGGKSLLGLQLGYYLDPTLNMSRVTFNGEEFGKAIDDAKRNECIIFDEAFNGLASSAAMSKMNRFLVRKLMECRQKNLFIIIILPTIFLIQKYVAIFRSKALFHVYVGKNGLRGHYRVYNTKTKKQLYLIGHKMYSYSQPWIRKNYIFRGKYPLDEQEYRKKKAESLIMSEEKAKVDKYAMKFGIMAGLLNRNHNYSFSDLQETLERHNEPIHRTNIAKWIEKTQETPISSNEHRAIIL